MKYKIVLFFGVLCALPITQTKCAAEAQTELPQTRTPGYFDVEAFVEKVDNGELTDDEIRENLNRQNPPRHDLRGRKGPLYCTDTPVICAAGANYTEALTAFIRLGADLEKTNQRGFTPLMAAAEQNNQEATELLVQAGVDLNFQGFQGCSALIRAAVGRQLAATQALIDAKADLDIQDNYKQTALIKAIQGGSPSPLIVGALLNAKADTSVVDKYGKTAYVHATDPLYYPKELGAIPQMLVKAGAQPEAEIAALQNPPNRWNEFRIGKARISLATDTKKEEKPEQVESRPESAIIDADPEEIWV